MHIEPFTPHHLQQLEMRPSERERLDADPNALDKMVALAEYGVGGAIIHDGTIIGLIGYYSMWPGCLEVWAFPSVHVARYPMIYLRTAKRYLKAISETHKPRRIQTTSIADDLHNRWMGFLGFTNETPGGMKGYSVLGQTFNLWAITYGA